MWACLKWLPDTSPLAASMLGGRIHLGATYDRSLLKALADAQRLHTWLTFRANAGKKGSKVKQPEPLPHPEEAAKAAAATRPRVSVADLVRHSE